MNKSLLVISHTEHYRNVRGDVVGWEATVREIDELATIFEHVIHAACFYSGAVPSGVAGYSRSNVTFIPLPPFGGKGLRKLSIFYTAPVIIWKVFSVLKRVTHFQFRAPTSMGVYLIPLLTWFSKKGGWFKFAGNWAEQNPPLSYYLQRRFLAECQSRPVTINGKWKNQPHHCFTFENPCLDHSNLISGSKSLKRKSFMPPFTLCFSGRLENAKGVNRILDSLMNLTNPGLIKVVHFVGDGDQRFQYEHVASKLPIRCIFHGFLSRDQLFKIFEEADFFLLPSTASEGFPKVVAEAANFGCVPVVSNISSIPQYVDDNCGFVWDTRNDFTNYLSQVLNSTPEALKVRADRAHTMATHFTYTRYIDRINQEVLN